MVTSTAVDAPFPQNGKKTSPGLVLPSPDTSFRHEIPARLANRTRVSWTAKCLRTGLLRLQQTKWCLDTSTDAWHFGQEPGFPSRGHSSHHFNKHRKSPPGKSVPFPLEGKTCHHAPARGAD